MTTSTPPKLPGTPKPWMNTAMRIMMGLPGLRRLLGRMFAVITVTGATSGRRYTTPVQYMRLDGDYVVLSQRHRVWWRNVRRQPEVTLNVGGENIVGRARIAEDDDARHVLTTCLTANPRVADFYGIDPAGDGTIDPVGIERLSERVVPIVITPDR